MKFTTFYIGLFITFIGLLTSACEPTGLNPDDYCKDGKCLNFDTLAKNLQKSCDNQTVGYGYVVYQKGTARKLGSFGLERTAADGGNLNYDIFHKQMIGSVSKTMTAIAVCRALDKRNISLDTKISNYLPSSWTKGQNINTITFRMLMNHTSGFRGCSGCGDNTYTYLKTLVENGVNLSDQTGSYDNANFGIFRIILPYILGYQPGSLFSNINAETSNIYLKYMQDSVFEVAGVGNPQEVLPSPISNQPIYTYNFPYTNGNGWLGDDYTENCGGFGWYMSVLECGVVMRELMHSEKIMSASMRTKMLDAGLGIDPFTGQAHGTYYAKRGRWINNGRGANTVVAVFPNDIQIVLFVNSDPLNQDIRTLVINAYDKAWVK